jgi:phenylalanyl-tRNA synthetase beta chain
MKFSWEWLQEHIKLNMTAEEAAELLSAHGLTVDEIIPAGDDVVFDIDITTNRPDAMNTRGIARELSAITGISLESLADNYHEITKPAHELASVDIQDPKGCHRFCARVITNAKNGPSPDWMVRRLESVGMRSVNLLVDITNYVMWELGHPMHGYDLSKIPKGKLIVRPAKKGETVELIDGSKPKLVTSDLMIADSDRAIGLAGVMGGADSEISDTTKDILLECAYFDAVSVRRTSKKHGIMTEASYRFERGMDHDDIEQAIDRTCHLYQKLAGSEICKEIIDEYPAVHTATAITMYHDKLCQFAGLDISRDKVAAIFSALEFSATYKENIWKVIVPSRRVDIERPADLYEEIIRIIGFDKIPATIPHVNVAVRQDNKLHKIIDTVNDSMLSVNFTEVMNYDFIDPDDNKLMAPADAGEPISVTNPIAAPQMTTMRQSLVASLMVNMRHNHNRGNTGLQIFETARTFFQRAAGPEEIATLAFALDAGPQEGNWRSSAETVDFFAAKGVAEYLFTRLGLSGIIADGGESTPAFLDGGQAVTFKLADSNTEIGWIGAAASQVQKHFDMAHPVYLGQLNLSAIEEAVTFGANFSRVSVYPSVSRDLSCLMPSGDKQVTFGKIKEAIYSTGVETIVDVGLIDIYQGKETGAGQSMTIRVIYQSNTQTLTQEEVEKDHAKVRESLSALGISFR